MDERTISAVLIAAGRGGGRTRVQELERALVYIARLAGVGPYTKERADAIEAIAKEALDERKKSA
jgi:hypothetical protein